MNRPCIKRILGIVLLLINVLLVGFVFVANVFTLSGPLQAHMIIETCFWSYLLRRIILAVILASLATGVSIFFRYLMCKLLRLPAEFVRVRLIKIFFFFLIASFLAMLVFYYGNYRIVQDMRVKGLRFD
ncbi:hypothetical protein DXN05_09890 [Deminuibacter soli]|uniref:Uncharacterized protein n=1 Tax=Deminuibacter soli TaxID=2291815 RepID=A0A3E1NMA6_9BACT|nr:hypothetical protein DXN05_09890 [Deminuibacter soli]